MLARNIFDRFTAITLASIFLIGAASLSACGGGDADSPVRSDDEVFEPEPEPGDGSCDLPAAATADRIVLFGGYSGEAVSTAAIAGPDAETTTALVQIEPGPEPLYVVLSTYVDTLWRFEGDVSRVDRIVLVGPSVQAVTGVEASRVTFRTSRPASLTETECFGPFDDAGTSEALVARGSVERELGRPVDVFAAAHDVGTLVLPAATVLPATASPVPDGFDPDVFQEALRFSPGGLVYVEPAEVVSQEPAADYDVLPAHFGLSQLVGAGALEPRAEGSFPEFYIAEPIARFPAGLNGSVSVIFILGRGVPMPAGDPGHSCVLSEETGLPLTSAAICP